MDKTKKKFSVGCMIVFWSAFLAFLYLIFRGINTFLNWWMGQYLLDPNSPMFQSRNFIVNYWWLILFGIIVAAVFWERICNGGHHHRDSVYH